MTKLEKIGLKWLNDNYGVLELFETEKYSNYIFHMKNGKCILQHNKENGFVYVNNGEIWSFFKSYFGMEYEQIQGLTKVWVEEQYKLGVTTTLIGLSPNCCPVEEQYKLGVTTTCFRTRVSKNQVEEQYKLGVTTTPSLLEGYGMVVEEQYKLGVTTTMVLDYISKYKVEEQYKLDMSPTSMSGTY